jgi:hypothetical protein
MYASFPVASRCDVVPRGYRLKHPIRRKSSSGPCWQLKPIGAWLQGYSFEERDVESKHNAPPTVRTYEVLMIDGSPYNRMVAIDDHPLSAGDRE